jgi:hypothetical protein
MWTGSSIFWARFILATFVVWLVAHLLPSEDGPWDVIARMLKTLGKGRKPGEQQLLRRTSDCVAEREKFEPSIQVLARITV